MNRSSFLALRPDEVAFYERLFIIGDTQKTGLLSAQMIQKLMGLSKLSNDVLAKIWTIAANKKRELTKDDFFVACRSVALAQTGYPVTNESLMKFKELPLPYFEGVSQPQAVNEMKQNIPQSSFGLMTGGLQSMPIQSPPSAAPVLSDADWSISPTEAQQYLQFFSTADANRDLFVSGSEAREFFAQSNLPQAQLTQIWNLADMDHDSKLSSREFAIAMHLVMKVRQSIPLPSVLPVTLANYSETVTKANVPVAPIVLNPVIPAPISMTAPKSNAYPMDEIAMPPKIVKAPSMDLFAYSVPAVTTYTSPIETKNLVTDINVLKAQVESAQNQINQLAPERQNMKSLSENEAVTASEWRDKVSQSQKQLESVRTDIESYKEQINLFRQQSQQFEIQFTKLQSEIDEWNNKKAESEQMLLHARTEFQNAQNDSAKQSQTLAQLQAQYHNNQAQLTTINSQMVQINEQLVVLTQEYESVRNSLSSQESTLEGESYELSILNSRLQHLLELRQGQQLIVDTRNDQANKIAREKSVVMEKIAAVSKDLASLKQSNQKLKETNSVSENELTLLKGKLQSSQIELKGAKELAVALSQTNSSPSKPVVKLVAPLSNKPDAAKVINNAPQVDFGSSNPFEETEGAESDNPFTSNVTVSADENVFLAKTTSNSVAFEGFSSTKSTESMGLPPSYEAKKNVPHVSPPTSGNSNGKSSLPSNNAWNPSSKKIVEDVWGSGITSDTKSKSSSAEITKTSQVAPAPKADDFGFSNDNDSAWADF